MTTTILTILLLSLIVPALGVGLSAMTKGERRAQRPPKNKLGKRWGRG